jgi:phosphatidylinositol-3-phosphatase
MAPERRCGACGSQLDQDQRYCLTCGGRAGERSPQLSALLAKVAAREPPGPAAGAAPGSAAAVPGPAAAKPRTVAPPLPGPRISALLVAVFVAFGALIGDAVAGDGTAQPAREVRLITPQGTGASASTGSPAGSTQAGSPEAGSSEETGSSEAGSEPPEAESQATPSPASGKTSGTGSETSSAANETSSGGGSKGGSKGGSSHGAATPARKLTSIKHVFVIMLSDQPYAALFGPESTAHYLSSTLERKGELLISYDAIAHEELPNGIALLSGQGPTAQTAADCPTYATLAPGSAGPDEQALGSGCVYPGSVETLPGELAGKHLRWRAYVQGIGEGASGPAPCSHPATGAADGTFAGGAYATFENPVVYFESLVQSPACQTNDVGLSQLKGDLASAAKTPNFSYIVPDRCHDAAPAPCTPGAAAGPAAAVPQLEEMAGEILASPAFKKDGLLVITGDEAPSSGDFADSSSCCGQPKYPNYTAPGFGQGGGQVGALLLSPFIKGGTSDQERYNHFTLLRTIEDIFGVRHLGYAALPVVKSLPVSLLNG